MFDRDEVFSMALNARANNIKQIAAASRAVNYITFEGEMPPPPTGIFPARWRAMINSIIKNGEPL